MWPLPIVDFSFALVVFLDIFSLLILLRRLLRSLRGDDNVIIRIFVRFVVSFFFDIVPRGRFLMLGIRGIVLLLDVLGLLAWDVTGGLSWFTLASVSPCTTSGAGPVEESTAAALNGWAPLVASLSAPAWPSSDFCTGAASTGVSGAGSGMSLGLFASRFFSAVRRNTLIVVRNDLFGVQSSAESGECSQTGQDDGRLE